jgi:thiol-disulfide isomerase/thioredoxin
MWTQSEGLVVRIKRLRVLLFIIAIASGLLLNMDVSFAAGEQVFSPFPGHPIAPKLKLFNMDGKQVDLEKLKGQVVLVNFWATWCPPCRREMPSLQRLWLKLGKSKIQIVAVNVGEDADTVLSFMGMLDDSPTFPIVFDKDSAVLRAWPVKGLPTTFLIDKKGHIAYRAIGGRDFDSPENIRFITELLASKNGHK